MHTIILILLIVAALSFLGAALSVPSKVNLVALGLLAWVAALIVPKL